MKLFTERGYDGTALREIAEELGVTKAALYYHFKSKEEIIEGIVQDTKSSVDRLIEWAASQPKTLESRREILARLAELLKEKWRPLILFTQANQTQMQKMRHGKESFAQIQQIFSIVREPDAEPVAAFRSTLAVMALMLAHSPAPFLGDLGADSFEVALQVAFELISK